MFYGRNSLMDLEASVAGMGFFGQSSATGACIGGTHVANEPDYSCPAGYTPTGQISGSSGCCANWAMSNGICNCNAVPPTAAPTALQQQAAYQNICNPGGILAQAASYLATAKQMFKTNGASPISTGDAIHVVQPALALMQSYITNLQISAENNADTQTVIGNMQALMKAAGSNNADYAAFQNAMKAFPSPEEACGGAQATQNVPSPAPAPVSVPVPVVAPSPSSPEGYQPCSINPYGGVTNAPCQLADGSIAMTDISVAGSANDTAAIQQPTVPEPGTTFTAPDETESGGPAGEPFGGPPVAPISDQQMIENLYQVATAVYQKLNSGALNDEALAAAYAALQSDPTNRQAQNAVDAAVKQLSDMIDAAPGGGAYATGGIGGKDALLTHLPTAMLTGPMNQFVTGVESSSDMSQLMQKLNSSASVLGQNLTATVNNCVFDVQQVFSPGQDQLSQANALLEFKQDYTPVVQAIQAIEHLQNVPQPSEPMPTAVNVAVALLPFGSILAPNVAAWSNYNNQIQPLIQTLQENPLFITPSGSSAYGLNTSGPAVTFKGLGQIAITPSAVVAQINSNAAFLINNVVALRMANLILARAKRLAKKLPRKAKPKVALKKAVHKTVKTPKALHGFLDDKKNLLLVAGAGLALYLLLRKK